MSEQIPEVPASLAGTAQTAAGVGAGPVATAAAVAAGEPLLLSAVAARIQRPQIAVPLYLDAEAASQIQDAEDALARAIEYDKTANAPDTAPALARHVRDLEDAAEASKAVFVLRALPHRAYQKLRAQYPPTADQIAKAAEREDGREAVFDPDTFSPALVAAQLVSPVIDSAEIFEEFWEELNDGQMNELWTAAVSIQMGVTDPGPKSESASRLLESSGIS
ncbi:hypothetical protein [Actinacidiphila sp. ITFR-21]|uniref:hypothetical protein n=1 Tax=Actinacidiphila sp. ITFR-21 TaxID=3075199 RepID=UPI00288BEA44|nr:hypothetical protein [Streptomyces sp. ITFR-21]WNI16613.1 hypothetical protein RLT57_14575 [Streptomyces sp. ITFR-21]